jgi:hypothetical protein
LLDSIEFISSEHSESSFPISVEEVSLEEMEEVSTET